MKNVIFDFGNVLVKWEPERVYSRLLGDEAKAWWVLRHVVSSQWRGRIDAGERTADCVAELVEQFPDYRSAIEAFEQHYDEMLTGEVEGMRGVVSDLISAGYQLYGLTNWSMETFPAARERFDILKMIDRYVVSGAEGLIKPDPRLFQVLLDRYGLKAEECLFVDDNSSNVEAARALGMEGVVFTSADELRRVLGLYAPIPIEVISILEAQGNTAEDWKRVKACSPDMGWAKGIVGNRFEGEVRLSKDVKITYSTIRNSAIGEGTVVSRVGLLDNYDVDRNCRLLNVNEVSFNEEGVKLSVMNENGGRAIGICRDMTVGEAYLWARYRDRVKAMKRLEDMTDNKRGYIGERSELRNATAVIDGVIGPGCKIGHGVIAERFLLGENVVLDAGLRLNDTVVGDNSTLARGEVVCSLIFPAHEQHHNSSFLIAALVQGQSNIASGATLGSNHNGRTADGELSAGRGFWPGLCVSLKHNCRFGSYTLLSKADYPSELNITLPFALVNNNVVKNRLEVMPAYWWLYNMYALQRNIKKYSERDRRLFKRQHVEFSPLAPDTAEELLVGRGLLYFWTTKAYQDGGVTEVVAYGMERGPRKTVVLKPGEGYRAYEEMLIYYAMTALGDDRPTAEGERIQRWVNLGGQLVAGPDMDQLLEDIEAGKLATWQAIHNRLDELWMEYPAQKRQHAYGVLCEFAQKKSLTSADWSYFEHRFRAIEQLVRDRTIASRQKDSNNEFRHTTFWNTEEMQNVMQW